MDPADFDSDDSERAPVHRRHPNAGTASIEAMTRHLPADHLSSNKRSAELTDDSGSPSVVESRTRWQN